MAALTDRYLATRPSIFLQRSYRSFPLGSWNGGGNALRKGTKASKAPIKPGRNSAWELVGEPIPEGYRNESLTRIAGYLRLYHREQVLEALLIGINKARCQPPLERQEVRVIVKSVFRYAQTGTHGWLYPDR